MSMKRLIDETSSDYERSLLDAGRDVGSPEVGKRRLLAMLAAGAVGAGAGQLGVGKAWAGWVSTSAKIGLVVAVTSGAAAVLHYRYESADSPRERSEENAQFESARGAPGSSPTGASVTAGRSSVSPMPTVEAPAAAHGAHENGSSAPRTPAKTTSSARALRSKSHTPEVKAPQHLLMEEAHLLQNLRDAVARSARAEAAQISRTYWARFAAEGQLHPEAKRLDERWRALAEPELR
jgi:hypothetical protein